MKLRDQNKVTIKREFKKFLKKRDIFHSFINQSDYPKDLYENNPVDWVSYNFLWLATEEKNDFWQDIELEWINLLNSKIKKRNSIINKI